MIAKNIDGLIKEVTELYNKDKLPTQTKSATQIESMVKLHFFYMRKYFQQPYSVEFNMEKVARFKLRYRYIRAKINELVKEAKVIRDGKLSKIIFNRLKNRYELEGMVDQEDVLVAIKEEIRYWWILKLKFMDEYTKTSRYKRLQILRKKWQEESAPLKYHVLKLKESYKPYVITQMPLNKDKWLIDK